MPLVGGLGDEKVADDTIHAVVSSLKEDLKAKIQEKRSSNSVEFELTPVSYKSQVVAGVNFFVKIKLAESEFIHARIYRDLSQNCSLHSVSEVKLESDEIMHF